MTFSQSWMPCPLSLNRTRSRSLIATRRRSGRRSPKLPARQRLSAPDKLCRNAKRGPYRPPLFFSELFGLLSFARGFGFGMLMKMFEAEAVRHRLPMVETANDIVHVLVRLVLEGVR